MRRYIFIFLLSVFGIVAFADEVCINGLYYLLNKDKQTAEVTYKSYSAKTYPYYNEDWNITEANIPSTVLYKRKEYHVIGIRAHAFDGCQSLTSVTIPNGVRTIKEYTFQDCKNLTSVIIPNSVTSIEKSAFQRCRSLPSVTIPNSVTSIGSNAFDGCSSLTSLPISSSIKRIEDWAFGNCISVTSVTIPDGVSIHWQAFEGCDNLTSVTVNSLDFLKHPMNSYFENMTKCIIGDKVTKIPQSAFTYCRYLTSITIPNSVTSIGYSAFSHCSSLTSVTIPNSVTLIEDYAFGYCSSLTSMSIPNSVISIKMGAFFSCTKLTSVYIGNGVLEIERLAFISCDALKEVYYPSDIEFPEETFSNKPKMIAYNRATPPSNPFQTSAQPPFLALVDGSLTFMDGNSNNRLDTDEKCQIKFQIKNNGKGLATNCEARVKMSGTTDGITVVSYTLPTIAVGQTYDVAIPISTNVNTKDGKVTFAIEVYEPQGWGVAPFDLTVATKAYEAPFLQVVDYNIASNSGKIQKMVPFTLQFNLQNTKYGDAEDVKVKVNLPNDVYVMDGKAEHTFPLIKSGEVKPIQLQLAANNNYTAVNIPVTIDIKEKHGKFAENKQLDIALNQTTSSSINIAAKNEPQQERKEIQLAMIKSEVDRNIPVTSAKNPNTFVLIVANEHYQQVAAVPFALNDGNIFREYCIKTLGISEKHIHYVPDATGNQIKAQVNWLANITEAFDHSQIIVYYAGHGIPDESSKTAYLLPVDGNGSDVTTGYKLDDLYKTLGNMPASQITVFMDACFSGSKREEGMLASARGVALKAKSGVPQGNMVVFSAAQGDETAYPNREQQHGLFTYYLLKKLQESAGDIALKDLGDYITKQVSQQSLLLNDKKQTPCVTPSASVASEWQSWKLK